uniref:Transmembrane protein 156 n=1 Tax=Nannospalax galili TaxID=1026970 RepID=A0A8C6WAY4_NANGA
LPLRGGECWRGGSRMLFVFAERTLELSCLEVCLQPNFTNPHSSLNFSFVTFLHPARETQTIMGMFLNHSNFQSFTENCQDIAHEFKMCSLCLVCESKGDMDLISQEQTPKGLIMKGSMRVKANDVYSHCQSFNFTVTPVVDPTEEYNATCTSRALPSKSTTVAEDSTREKSVNHTCKIMANTSNCTQISLYLEIDVKNVTCSMRITWYILVLLVFIFFIILVIHKILEDHRRLQTSQSHKYESASVLLKGSDSEKLRALNMQVISESTQGLPLVRAKEMLPTIPEVEVTSAVLQQEQYAQ